MKKLSIFFATIVTIGSFVAATVLILNLDDFSENDTSKISDDFSEPQSNLSSEPFVSSMNEFAVSMYNSLDMHDENLMFSPYSIYVCLSMIYEGAIGETADELQDILVIPQHNETMHQKMKSLSSQLNHDDGYIIHTANAIWHNINIELLVSYHSLIQNYYDAYISPLDFSQPEEAAETINGWVAQQTQQKITKLIESSDINPSDTSMVLTNAMYFKAFWEYQFNPDKTMEQPFYLANGSQKTVPMMIINNSVESFNYTETETMQIIELLYDNCSYSMILFLPKDNYSLSQSMKSLSIEELVHWKSNAAEQLVNIYLPRFSIEKSIFLKSTLEKMGLTKLFNSSAELSNITGESNLFLSKSIHKSWLKVNETGTEAAASTGNIMVYGLKKEFNANHPFFFIIQDQQTSDILFLGHVYNPGEMV